VWVVASGKKVVQLKLVILLNFVPAEMAGENLKTTNKQKQSLTSKKNYKQQTPNSQTNWYQKFCKITNLNFRTL